MLSYHNFFLKSNTFACDLHWILDPPFERDEAFLACKINKTKIWILKNWFWITKKIDFVCTLLSSP
jgi:hypothetical protein